MTLALLAAALASFAIGAAAVFGARHGLKQVVGLAIAQAGACLGALALGAVDLALAGLAALFAAVMLGAALIVRLQEAYGGVEGAEIDAADAADEPADDAP